MKKSLITVFAVALFSIFPASAQVFKLNPVTDSILAGAGTAIYGTDLILAKGLKVNQNLYQGESFNLNDVNGFDAFFAREYNKTIDTISDVTLCSAFLFPGVLAGTEKSEWLTLGVMYAETLLLTQGIKECIKLGVYRPRPYMYFDASTYPEKDVYEDHDWANSFLSGHSSMTFACATFATYTFSMYYPDSPWRFAVAGLTYGIAAGTAALRMAGGMHFATDVLCGAVLGTAIGFLVPWLHTFGTVDDAPGRQRVPRNNSVAPMAMVSPLGIDFCIRF